MPSTQIQPDQFIDGKIGILDLLVICKLASSKSEARRLVTQGGIFIGDEKVLSIDFTLTEEQLKTGVKIKKGKKVFHKALLKE